MNGNLKDILANLNAGVDQETLLKYLQGHLTAEEQREVEKNLLDENFEADAVEGLQAMPDKTHITMLVEQLNRDLKKKTTRKKRRFFKREAKVEPWLLMAIVLILLLAVIGFLVIRQMK